MENYTDSSTQKRPHLKQVGALLILILVIADQLTKYLAVSHLKGQPGIVLLDKILALRYLENKGMAFGLLQGKIFFLVAVCLVFFAVILYLFVKIPETAYYAPLLYT